MTTSAVFYPHAIDLDGGTTVITQMSDVTPANNYTDLVEFSAGQTSPQYSGSQFAIPDITFTTGQLNTFLGAVDTEGVAVDLSAASVDLYYKKGLPHGTREADASLAHLRGRLTTNALLYWTGLRASQGGQAELTARLLPVWDGTNNPLIWTGSLALAGTSQAAEQFTLGRIDLNGVNIASVQDLDWQNNIVTEEVGDSGEPFITYGAIDTYSTSFTFHTRNTEVLATYGAAGTALTSFEVYLRRKVASGINVADVTATHVKLHKASAAGTIKARSVTGLKGMAEVFVQLTKASATADLFDIVAASAIT